MAWYNIGTVAVTNNGTTVTGTGTNWTQYVDAGQGFRGPDGLIYEIATVVSATQITLATAYKGATASGQAYSISPEQGYIRDLALQAADLVLSFAAVRDNAGAGMFGDGSAATPGVRFVNDQDTGFYRPGTNTIACAVNGTEVFRCSTAGFTFADPANVRTALGLGTASLKNTGTSGSNIPLLDGANTWASNQVFSGTVGVGASPPSVQFGVQGPNVTTFAPNVYTMTVSGNDSATSGYAGAGINFRGNYTGSSSYADLAFISGIKENATDGNYAGALVFGTRANGSGGGSFERMRIDSGGNVGIGAASPEDKLHLAGWLRFNNNLGINFKSTAGTFTSGTAGGMLQKGGDNNFYFDNYDGNFYFRGASYASRLSLDSTNAGFNLHVIPASDNSKTLGSGPNRWSVVYAATGSINTSDERTKQDIAPIPDEWLDAWAAVDWRRYKFIDAVQAKGDDARWHLGLVAQAVRDAFAARGLDAEKIGLLCYDQWAEQREPVYVTVTQTRMVEQHVQRTRMVPGEIAKTCKVEQERTNYRPVNPDDPDSLYEPFTETIEVERTYYEMGEVEEAYIETIEVEEEYEAEEDSGETRVTLEAGDRWGLRYDECQAMEAAWQRRELARKDALITSLAARLAALEAA